MIKNGRPKNTSSILEQMGKVLIKPEDVLSYKAVTCGAFVMDIDIGNNKVLASVWSPLIAVAATEESRSIMP